MKTLNNKKIILIKTNLVDRDPWLVKEINTLKNGGYEVILLCWDRERKVLSSEASSPSEYKEIRIKLKAPYGIKILLFLPIWWCFELFWLIKEDWDIVHAINIDSIGPAVIMGRVKSKIVIYELFDVYVDELVLPEIIRKLGIIIERFFMRLSDAVIIANEAQEIELNGIPNKNKTVIYNTPYDYFRTPRTNSNAPLCCDSLSHNRTNSPKK